MTKQWDTLYVANPEDPRSSAFEVLAVEKLTRFKWLAVNCDKKVFIASVRYRTNLGATIIKVTDTEDFRSSAVSAINDYRRRLAGCLAVDTDDGEAASPPAKRVKTATASADDELIGDQPNTRMIPESVVEVPDSPDTAEPAEAVKSEAPPTKNDEQAPQEHKEKPSSSSRRLTLTKLRGRPSCTEEKPPSTENTEKKPVKVDSDEDDFLNRMPDASQAISSESESEGEDRQVSSSEKKCLEMKESSLSSGMATDCSGPPHAAEEATQAKQVF